jgi:outer membrane protein assembly factor BamB
MHRRFTVLAAVAAATIGCLTATSSATATTAPSEWAQYAAGPSRHSSNPYETQINRATINRLSLVPGGFANDCQCSARPIISDGVVYSQVLGVGGATINAWDEQTGTFLWATPLYHPQGNFAVSDGVIVAADFFGNMYGFSTVDGSQLWSSPSGGSSAQPVIANGVVYVTYGHIQALDLHTGAVLWTGQALDDGGSSGPTVWQNEVFQATSGEIWAFDTSDGHLLWSSICPIGSAPQHSDRSPMVLHGVVYQGAGCALDAVTGAAVWNLTGSRVSMTGDATAGYRIFTTEQYGAAPRMEALGRTTGTVLWHHDAATTTTVVESPVVADGLVYYVIRDTGTGLGKIRAFNARTGSPIWTSAPEPGLYAISVADGRIWGIFSDNLVHSWALS